ncbi:OmpP1/FadL family transporter [Thiomicrospira cyclica]|uniref:Membrane protein involved in aromatic hydrocarbon degradation n=1 Tax=Thiomicrospira cyclica (strain DSM 14477 / JCM 11371 / ALM1) TaxID=717773 RepID=F6DA38_THICA|nr:outer membrane protein transport protein [Thiomicrospira cyclica]AEG32169.1 membrane protein involved in aromatic hydrocarbon degradation [Thiomicrospira cyclica ALM1]
MKPTRLALAIATAAMVSQPVLATNGDHLIGLGAQSRAMGGTGAAAFFGSENALTNPALIGKMQGTEFTIGGTVFMPRVKAETDVASQTGPVSQTSDANLSVIPEVSLATRINDNWVFGLGIFGTAGMGVDYRDNANQFDGTGLFNGYSNLQLMKFAPTLAYNDTNWGIGFAPVIQYGALDINYKQFVPDGNNGGELFNIGNGMSMAYGLGFNLGGYFDVTPELTLGLAYQSAIDMKYKDQISTAATGFGLSFSDNLEQPSEIKVGAAYTMGSMMYTADYKRIGWGAAKGYKDFNWEDQNVFAVGAKYTANNYWLGVGYNYGKEPIKKKSGSDYASQAINLLNNHFFPAVVESHFTFGGGYSFTDNLAVDMALTYAAQKTKKVDTSAVTATFNNSNQTPPTSHKVTHSQLGYTLALRMNF